MTVMAGIELYNGDQRIYFDGEMLSHASSEYDQRGRHKPRWSEITIYRTMSGKYVISKVGKSRTVHASEECWMLKNNEDPLAVVTYDPREREFAPCVECNPGPGPVVLENDHGIAVVADAPQGAVAACYSKDKNRLWNLSWLAEDALRQAFDLDASLERAFLNFDITSLGRRGV